MLNKAVELAREHGWFLCRQFENEANAEVHTRTTAREILADFEGERLHCLVTGFGTGGTLLGVARVLKAAAAASHHRGRARQLADPRQRDRRSRVRAARRREPPAFPAAPDAGLDPRLHLAPDRDRLAGS